MSVANRLCFHPRLSPSLYHVKVTFLYTCVITMKDIKQGLISQPVTQTSAWCKPFVWVQYFQKSPFQETIPGKCSGMQQFSFVTLLHILSQTLCPGLWYYISPCPCRQLLLYHSSFCNWCFALLLVLTPALE